MLYNGKRAGGMAGQGLLPLLILLVWFWYWSLSLSLSVFVFLTRGEELQGGWVTKFQQLSNSGFKMGFVPPGVNFGYLPSGNLN